MAKSGVVSFEIGVSADTHTSEPYTNGTPNPKISYLESIDEAAMSR